MRGTSAGRASVPLLVVLAIAVALSAVELYAVWSHRPGAAGASGSADG